MPFSPRRELLTHLRPDVGTQSAKEFGARIARIILVISRSFPGEDGRADGLLRVGRTSPSPLQEHTSLGSSLWPTGFWTVLSLLSVMI